MKNTFSITDRDREIVLAILHKVPVLSESALALWWPDTDDPATSAEAPPTSPQLVDPAPHSTGARQD